ncbi:12912_t:CDS:2 [Acaulospora colombiana]|uniref:12912_t:CDS:1 n=1 Tax=Acaulospora colombiana TaxID=27376 RepID=A0ACA9NQB3_9GLOM|nr:12912_t:CDS:2 [Acaulospora colombiana]
MGACATWIGPHPHRQHSAMSLYEDRALQSSQSGIYPLFRLKNIADESPESATHNHLFGQSRLPNEVLITIIQFVHAKRELYALCLTNRFAREIATPILYLHYFANSQLARSFNDLDVVLQHPQFGHIVNTLRISLPSNSCPCIREYGLAPCSCTIRDEELGGVLINLPNLKSLDIDCDLCPPQGSHRHQYLLHLKTRVLQAVRFKCNCSRIGDVEMSKMLGSPSMDSVTSLDWNITKAHREDCDYLTSSLKHTSILSKLEELHHNGSRYDDSLWRYRQIRRLDGSYLCNWKALLNGGILHRGDISLTHLSLCSFFIKELAQLIEQDPNPLRNLRHIGTFAYFMDGPGLLEYLRQYTRLSKLVSFDVHVGSYVLLTDMEEFLDRYSIHLLTWFPDDDLIRDWGVLYEKCITDGCTENAAALIGHPED